MRWLVAPLAVLALLFLIRFFALGIYRVPPHTPVGLVAFPFSWHDEQGIGQEIAGEDDRPVLRPRSRLVLLSLRLDVDDLRFLFLGHL